MVKMHRRSFLSSAAGSIVVAGFGLPALADARNDFLVVGKRIDDMVTLDPGASLEGSASEVSRNVYRRLVNYDPHDLEAGYGPDVAEDWTVSEDGKSITFRIRQGLRFESGNPVRAEDAEFSLRRAIKMNGSPAFILAQFGFTPENVDDRIIADGDTLTITTDNSYAVSLVLNCLTATVGSIVDKETVLAHADGDDFGNGWLAINTAGSGPYKVLSWKANESIVMGVNETYVGPRPQVSRIMIRHIVESATQRLLLQKGDIDIARNLNPEDIKSVTNAEGMRVDSEQRGRLMYVALNQKNPTLANPKIREAVKYLIDYEGMQNSFLQGAWAVHQNIVPATYLGAVKENPFHLDLDRAKRLISEADVSDRPLQIGLRSGQEYLDIAQALQNRMAEVGLQAEILVGASSQIASLYRSRKHDIYIGSWGPDYPDPQTNVGTFAYNPDNSEEANAVGLIAWRNAWDTDGLNEQVVAAAQENDLKKREQMYHDIQARFRETAPIAVLFQQTEQAAVRDHVHGFSLGGAVTHPAYWNVTK